MKFDSSPWEVYGKCTPLARGTFHRDIAPMGLDDMFDNGKTQSRAAQFTTPPFVDPVEPFKEPGEVFRSYAAPMIADFYGNFTLVFENFNLYGTPGLTVFNGIVKEIPHCLLKKAGVGLYYNLTATL
jgi:hypothetical protein